MKQENTGYAVLSDVVQDLPADLRKFLLERHEEWRRSILSEAVEMRSGTWSAEDRKRLGDTFGRIAAKLGIRSEIEEILEVLQGPRAARKPPDDWRTRS